MRNEGFIQFIQHFLHSLSALGAVLGAEDILVNKTVKIPVLQSLHADEVLLSTY